VRRDLAGGKLAVADEGQDLPAPRTCDRFQRCFHGELFKQRLT
jgi:hypothetical protein